MVENPWCRSQNETAELRRPRSDSQASWCLGASSRPLPTALSLSRGAAPERPANAGTREGFPGALELLPRDQWDRRRSSSALGKSGSGPRSVALRTD